MVAWADGTTTPRTAAALEASLRAYAATLVGGGSPSRIGGLPRAVPPGQNLSTPGTLLGSNTKTSHIAPAAIVQLRVCFVNYYNNGGTETAGTNDITIRAAIEDPAGNKIPLFFQGKRDVVINPGGTVWSDWVSVSIAAATRFWTRTFLLLPNTSSQWPLTTSLQTSLTEGSTNSASPSDLTTSGTIGTGGSGYSPAAVQVGYIASGSLRLLGIGDSRMAGSGDTDTINGWWGRAFDGLAFYQRIAYASDTAQAFAANLTSRRKVLLEGGNVAICNYGINDLSSRTLAQLQGDILTIGSYTAARKTKIFQTTLDPKTTSTDSWATLGNQTSFAGEANRSAFNDWVRDGLPVTGVGNLTPVSTGTGGALRAGSAGHPFYSYLEIADAVESSRNSGKWAVGNTSDGIHPNATGHGLVAAVPNLTTLTAAAVLADAA